MTNPSAYTLPEMPTRPARSEYDSGWFEMYGRETSNYQRKLRYYYGAVKLWLIATRGPACEACGVTLDTAADAHKHLVTHHIVPRSAGGGDESRNLLLLCGDCHSSQHDFPIRGKARPKLPPEVSRPVQADRFLSLAQLVDAAIARREEVPC